MSSTSNTDRQTPPLGARLRSQRMAMGLSLADASRRCGVRQDYLGALERHDLSALPTIGYGLGYVRAYARTLGLDTEQSVADFKRDSEVPFDLDRPSRPHFVPTRRVRLPRDSVPALGVLAAVVMLGMWYGVQLDTVAAPSPSAAVTFDPANIEAPTRVANNVLTVHATAPSWVSIRDGRGRLVVNRVFVTGETWQAETGQSFTLGVRDAGAVELWVGGANRGPLGSAGVPMKNLDLSIVR